MSLLACWFCRKSISPLDIFSHFSQGGKSKWKPDAKPGPRAPRATSRCRSRPRSRRRGRRGGEAKSVKGRVLGTHPKWEATAFFLPRFVFSLRPQMGGFSFWWPFQSKRESGKKGTTPRCVCCFSPMLTPGLSRTHPLTGGVPSNSDESHPLLINSGLLIQ